MGSAQPWVKVQPWVKAPASVKAREWAKGWEWGKAREREKGWEWEKAEPRVRGVPLTKGPRRRVDQAYPLGDGGRLGTRPPPFPTGRHLPVRARRVRES